MIAVVLAWNGLPLIVVVLAGTACLTHRTVDIEQASTHSERTGALECSDDIMQQEIFLLQSLQR